MKTKTFTLISGKEGSYHWSIETQVFNTGDFHTKGTIFRRKLFRGFVGMFKRKPFVYKVKLPKGAIRHHVVYRDEDPNYGIIFCTRGYHNWVHKRKGGMRI